MSKGINRMSGTMQLSTSGLFRSEVGSETGDCIAGMVIDSASSDRAGFDTDDSFSTYIRFS